MKRQLVWINLVGGCAVLGSYAVGLMTHPHNRAELWGEIPVSVRGPYSAMMYVAAAGYFMFMYYLLRSVNAGEARVINRWDYRYFSVCTGGLLLFSSIWMPLSLYGLDTGNTWILPWIQVDLAMTAIFSLGVLLGVYGLRPVTNRRARAVGIFGAFLFCVQTVLLDALIWPRFFSL